jgi:hypothetical protein
MEKQANVAQKNPKKGATNNIPLSIPYANSICKDYES